MYITIHLAKCVQYATLKTVTDDVTIHRISVDQDIRIVNSLSVTLVHR